eukprot:TRINITY_DN15539_c0_g1_i1.p1 TRINITY_DN15539_c0_g1~~TRINITY_DN15539_c0_g1_i1.p1  ORF type:complete len:414 (+),score=204.87 TRINITY_DN15539_c0_g1_i1:47-1243(+)
MGDDVRSELNQQANAQLESSESFMDVPMEELMGWADLPPLKEGEEVPGWRRRLEDPEGWRELPLFMEAVPEDSENPQVQALADIMYNDISKEELAEKCKEKGNIAMKQASIATGGTAGVKGPYRTALSFYTEGINAGSSDLRIVAALHANRAQANLGLENYGHCVADCQDSLRINKDDVKCCFRAAKACNAVKKPDRARMFIRRGLAIDPNNKALQGQLHVADEMDRLIKRLAKGVAKKTKETLAAWYESVQLLVDSGIKVGKTELRSEQWSQYGAQGPRLVDGALHISMLLVYDEYNTSDFTIDVMLEHSLLDHLGEMFPPTGQRPEWDECGRYVLGGLTAFYQVGDKMREIDDLSEPFSSLLKRSDYFCPGFLPTFHVIPTGALYAQKWRTGEYYA